MQRIAGGTLRKQFRARSKHVSLPEDLYYGLSLGKKQVILFFTHHCQYLTILHPFTFQWLHIIEQTKNGPKIEWSKKMLCPYLQVPAVTHYYFFARVQLGKSVKPANGRAQKTDLDKWLLWGAKAPCAWRLTRTVRTKWREARLAVNNAFGAEKLEVASTSQRNNRETWKLLDGRSAVLVEPNLFLPTPHP